MTLNQMHLAVPDIKELSSATVITPQRSYPLHVIVPVFNEEHAIKDVIHRIKRVLRTYPYETKITVIDDGSTDKTIEKIGSEPEINLVTNRINQGKARSLNKCFRMIGENEIVVLIDGDGEHPPEEIMKLVTPILKGKADIVIGTRFSPKFPLSLEKAPKGSYLNNHKRFSKIRKFGNIIISILIFLLYKQYISDSQSGYRAFKPGILMKYQSKFTGFEIETEMTLELMKRGYRLYEVPITTGLSTRESHMHIFRDSLKIFKTILVLKYC
ncbi:MAG: glycosyltransferase family 2 protein [Candidatus Lokiarchaeota archaeon]|nr:glycosyltransferase family 2 protein [Candidatus Harpocratesius repetitus]